VKSKFQSPKLDLLGVCRDQLGADDFMTSGDPPRSLGGYGERAESPRSGMRQEGMNLESMKAGTGTSTEKAKPCLQRS